MSQEAIDPQEYAATDSELLDLILEESDKRVATQVQLMVAGDSRAAALLAACITLAAGGVGFTVSRIEVHDALFWSSLVFGLIESIAAGLALWALKPQPIHVPGWAPATFRTDLSKPLSRVKAEMAQHLQDRIEKNREIAKELSWRSELAMFVASQAPLWAMLAALIAQQLYLFSVGMFIAALVSLGALKPTRSPKRDAD